MGQLSWWAYQSLSAMLFVLWMLCNPHYSRVAFKATWLPLHIISRCQSWILITSAWLNGACIHIYAFNISMGGRLIWCSQIGNRKADLSSAAVLYLCTAWWSAGNPTGSWRCLHLPDCRRCWRCVLALYWHSQCTSLIWTAMSKIKFDIAFHRISRPWTPRADGGLLCKTALQRAVEVDILRSTWWVCFAISSWEVTLRFTQHQSTTAQQCSTVPLLSK